MKDSTIPDGYIIEHPTRGILMELYQEFQFEWKARWSWSKPRTLAQRFSTIAEVRMAMSRIPEKQRRQASVLRWGSWSKVLDLSTR